MSEESRTLNSQIAPSLVQQAMALIQPAQRIALLAHESPDGDCIGSALSSAFPPAQMPHRKTSRSYLVLRHCNKLSMMGPLTLSSPWMPVN